MHAGRDPEPLIRDATAADAAAVARLLAQLGYPAEPSAAAARLERLAIVGDRVVVAEAGGEVVGLAHLQVVPALEYDRPVGRIAALVVDEARRGTGIGRSLLEAVDAEARARGCALIFLTTSEHRAASHSFYEQAGLEQTGRRYGRTLSE
ncbi:MAG TPA: GNAT family N-acetyltransferase [Gaiellaceae bacterium]|nr:GNAT family N-acetyltransferase [Gaiellaceae bacterium]